MDRNHPLFPALSTLVQTGFKTPMLQQILMAAQGDDRLVLTVERFQPGLEIPGSNSDVGIRVFADKSGAFYHGLIQDRSGMRSVYDAQFHPVADRMPDITYEVFQQNSGNTTNPIYLLEKSSFDSPDPIRVGTQGRESELIVGPSGGTTAFSFQHEGRDQFEDPSLRATFYDRRVRLQIDHVPPQEGTLVVDFYPICNSAPDLPYLSGKEVFSILDRGER
ncbi:hypothetical protein CL620_00340 [archaeon]|nr:hypothetical protein [archaeon]